MSAFTDYKRVLLKEILIGSTFKMSVDSPDFYRKLPTTDNYMVHYTNSKGVVEALPEDTWVFWWFYYR